MQSGSLAAGRGLIVGSDLIRSHPAEVALSQLPRTTCERSRHHGYKQPRPTATSVAGAASDISAKACRDSLVKGRHGKSVQTLPLTDLDQMPTHGQGKPIVGQFNHP